MTAFPPILSRAAYGGAWVAAHALGLLGRPMERPLLALRDRVRTRICRGLAEGSRPRPRAVPRVQIASTDALRLVMRRRSAPMVLAGAAADWPCCRTWTPEWFVERHGDYTLPHLNVSRDDLAGAGYAPEHFQVTLRDVVEDMARGGRLYARFGALLDERRDLLDDLDLGFLRAARGRPSFQENLQFFMGGAGTSTALHNALGSNLFVQVWGEKRWTLVPPAFTAVLDPPLGRAPYFFSSLDLEASPEAEPDVALVERWEVTLLPGDVLYNPPFWWHQVSNPTPSIGVGYRWYEPREMLRASPAQTLLTLAATNPSVATARRYKGDFARVFTTSRPAAQPPSDRARE